MKKHFNLELFVARRISRDREAKKAVSRPITRISIVAVALSLAVMIVSVAIVTGFKNQITDKVLGFGGHIQIQNYDSNTSYETRPITDTLAFVPKLTSIPGIAHTQIYAYKPGIIKTKTDIQGVVLKGVSTDFDWSFFKKNLTEGTVLNLSDSTSSNQILISKSIANLLKLSLGDKVDFYFVQEPPRVRRFKIVGIYDTKFDEFDKTFVFCDIKQIQALNGWSRNQISGIELTTSDFNNVDEITNRVEDLAGFTVLPDGSGIKVTNIKEKYSQIFDWLNLQDTNVAVILFLMLFVAGFNMISGLLIFILERTFMIGVLKALGARNWMIQKIFLYHSAYVTGLGLFWGNVIGIGLCFLQQQFHIIKLDESSYYLSSVPINLQLSHILMLNAGTFAAVFVMLLIPSLLISRITPEKTLRYS
ncbi:MAG TPA: ABC transporter permease [Williamwhitmania sp.]|nr:ABC transporter permease [Williamwhitmania sp.]